MLIICLEPIEEDCKSLFGIYVLITDSTTINQNKDILFRCNYKLQAVC
jgi:hypothetical protein